MQIKDKKIFYTTIRLNDKAELVDKKECKAFCFLEELKNNVLLELVKIPAGSFTMGALPGYGSTDEHPQHYVSVKEFYLGKVPITQKQWASVMKKPLAFRTNGENKPVDRVSWLNANKFCLMLKKITGRDYRLPTEAEWEYSCRAGSLSAFSFGPTISTEYANYVGDHIFLHEPKGIYRHGTTDAASFYPNAFGLYDMHGNVWEWCEDEWHDSYEGAPDKGVAWLRGEKGFRVLRGGSWHDTPQICTSTARLRQKGTENEDYFGFRVALSIRE